MILFKKQNVSSNVFFGILIGILYKSKQFIRYKNRQEKIYL